MRQLYWLDRRPKSAPLIKDIAINLKNQFEMDSGHQYNIDHRNVLMDQTNIQIKGGQQIIQVAINELYLNITPRI